MISPVKGLTLGETDIMKQKKKKLRKFYLFASPKLYNS